MTSIKIKEVEIYHPEKVVNNDYYIQHFKEKKDISHFLEVMGRENRYVIDNEEENGLTMGIDASKKVLKKANLTGEDIDLIVFTTQVPETTFPSNATYVHDAIDAKHDTIIMDTNANCAGMTVAVEQASYYMKANPYVSKALIIGSDYNTLVSNPEEEITYACYGDAAAAVILEKTEEEDTGFIDSIYFTDSINRDMIRFPKDGLTKSILENRSVSSISWLPFDGGIALPPTYEMFNKILERNHLTTKDIKAYCLSQFALSNILKIQDHYTLQDEQLIYVGDRFGYTGTSSPFIALYEGIETGRIQRGDYILFWTIGSGYELVATLFKY
ncbi:3-oxoacyl-[acyl-carrier-protein] synthase III C-terminal domain-containing protein [Salinibacillus xinjiangensis]|uniref:Ketoacyl-ACP synthase III n=1 Tax=Salinibacillus xinjiangensis TaxID=1229268 RepID=A0A6G1X8M2_9BACI|nr:3-oxoacyl-[acyl-carrier-protein] synthase III C-terminal domain-containing protein [Salinibacillus xinjiangensis]MRG87353.1 ketoacyl-ACP synthase III [Salinibacillus xinjiangensis]